MLLWPKVHIIREVSIAKNCALWYRARTAHETTSLFLIWNEMHSRSLSVLVCDHMMIFYPLNNFERVDTDWKRSVHRIIFILQSPNVLWNISLSLKDFTSVIGPDERYQLLPEPIRICFNSACSCSKKKMYMFIVNYAEPTGRESKGPKCACWCTCSMFTESSA